MSRILPLSLFPPLHLHLRPLLPRIRFFRFRFRFVFLFLVFPFLSFLSATNIHSDDALPSSKFTQREAMAVEDVIFGRDVSKFILRSECQSEFELVWTTTIDTGIYATPIITSTRPDGEKQIIIPGFHRELNILDRDGHRMEHSPFIVSNDDYFHTSPLLMDYNRDGINDYIWTSVNGEIFVVNGDHSGMDAILHTFTIPKLRVSKYWMGRNVTTKGRKTLAVTPGATAPPLTRHRAYIDTKRDAQNTDDFQDAFNQIGDGLTEEGKESLHLFMDDIDDPSLIDQHDDHMYPKSDEYVYIDAHILATPACIDVNNDDIPDLVISVSYFFDENDFANNPHLFTHVGSDIDIRNYVAGGLVAYDLVNQKIIWSQHLDLTTDYTRLKAYIYASPTVIDLDGNGSLEVIVGTSLGLIYVMNAVNGMSVSGFPIAMSEIQAQIAVEDVNGDGQLEMIALDDKGNVLCFNHMGSEIWSTHISGFAAQSATFGDIDGDGVMDVVVGTVPGHVWALKGTDGSVIPNFPIKTDGRIVAPITLVDMNTFNFQQLLDPSQKPTFGRTGLHLIFPSFDGHVYIIDGRSGCTNKLDIGEESYGQILVDDILGNGRMSLLVTTMTGSVFCFTTQVPYKPLAAWSSQVHGLNGFTARDNYHGIFVTPASRGFRNVQGSSFMLEFQIVDKRSTGTRSPRRYEVLISYLGSVVYQKSFTSPGIYHEHIPASATPAYAIVTIEMWNEHQQKFSDQIDIGMNVMFYRTIKYLLVLPLLLMSTLLLFVKSLRPSLPT